MFKDKNVSSRIQHAANALKRFLIGQFVKFFLLIGPSNASKHFQRDFDHNPRHSAV